MTDEAQTTCDCCEEITFWEDLATGDDGETWVCPKCVPPPAAEEKP